MQTENSFIYRIREGIYFSNRKRNPTQSRARACAAQYFLQNIWEGTKKSLMIKITDAISIWDS